LPLQEILKYQFLDTQFCLRSYEIALTLATVFISVFVALLGKRMPEFFLQMLSLQGEGVNLLMLASSRNGRGLLEGNLIIGGQIIGLLHKEFC
jgi:hypothetical protein